MLYNEQLTLEVFLMAWVLNVLVKLVRWLLASKLCAHTGQRKVVSNSTHELRRYPVL